jgi:hypothetical protein
MYDSAERRAYPRCRLVSWRRIAATPAELPCLLAHEFCQPHESVAGAIENFDFPNVHRDDPFAAERRYVGVYPAGAH